MCVSVDSRSSLTIISRANPRFWHSNSTHFERESYSLIAKHGASFTPLSVHTTCETDTNVHTILTHDQFSLWHKVGPQGACWTWVHAKSERLNRLCAGGDTFSHLAAEFRTITQSLCILEKDPHSRNNDNNNCNLIIMRLQSPFCRPGNTLKRKGGGNVVSNVRSVSKTNASPAQRGPRRDDEARGTVAPVRYFARRHGGQRF